MSNDDVSQLSMEYSPDKGRKDTPIIDRQSFIERSTDRGTAQVALWAASMCLSWPLDDLNLLRESYHDKSISPPHLHQSISYGCSFKGCQLLHFPDCLAALSKYKLANEEECTEACVLGRPAIALINLYNQGISYADVAEAAVNNETVLSSEKELANYTSVRLLGVDDENEEFLSETMCPAFCDKKGKLKLVLALEDNHVATLAMVTKYGGPYQNLTMDSFQDTMLSHFHISSDDHLSKSLIRRVISKSPMVDNVSGMSNFAASNEAQAFFDKRLDLDVAAARRVDTVGAPAFGAGSTVPGAAPTPKTPAGA